ncbi:hypothetical protein B0J14DRAFT_638145 [Halenospora varia]|nr:hypothetical protein B0J14DRAFT_638145 [Halenospora varia]
MISFPCLQNSFLPRQLPPAYLKPKHSASPSQFPNLPQPTSPFSPSLTMHLFFRPFPESKRPPTRIILALFHPSFSLLRRLNSNNGPQPGLQAGLTLKQTSISPIFNTIPTDLTAYLQAERLQMAATACQADGEEEDTNFSLDGELPRFPTLEIISFTSSLSQYTTMAPEKYRPSEGGVGCIFFPNAHYRHSSRRPPLQGQETLQGSPDWIDRHQCDGFHHDGHYSLHGGKHWKEVQLSKTELAQLSVAERGLAQNNLEMGPVSNLDEVPQLASVKPPLYSRTGAIGNEPGNPPSYFESHSSIPDPPVFPPGPFMPHTENQ